MIASGNLKKDIPETREVLVNHLLAQLRSLNLDFHEKETSDILGSLVRGLSNNEIIDLLKNENTLKRRLEEVRNINTNTQDTSIDRIKSSDNLSDREEIGEQLFQKVAVLDSQLCAQITGMLLEMDTLTLKKMMANDKELCEAVKRARSEYLQYIKGENCVDISCPPSETTESSTDSSPCEEKQIFGEKIYEMLSEKCPEHASKITGMLLELDTEALEKLMKSPEKLQEKVEIAVSALTKELDAPLKQL